MEYSGVFQGYVKTMKMKIVVVALAERTVAVAADGVLAATTSAPD